MDKTKLYSTPKLLMDTLSATVNNFSFSPEETADRFLHTDYTNLPDKADYEALPSIIQSCIHALAEYAWTDGRNEIAAEMCKQLDTGDDPLPECGAEFLHMHPTLQQTTVGFFGCYLEKADIPEYRDAISGLRENRGNKWYRMPLI